MARTQMTLKGSDIDDVDKAWKKAMATRGSETHWQAFASRYTII